MGAPRATGKVLLGAALALGAAVLTWYLRPPVEPQVTPARALPAQSVPALSAPTLSGTAATAAPAEQGTAAAVPSQPDPAALAAADEHQSGKIARGFKDHGGNGLLVSAAPPGSLTEQLRLQPGDVVVTVNGEAVASVDDFVRIYRSEGMPTELTVLRKGREIHLH